MMGAGRTSVPLREKSARFQKYETRHGVLLVKICNKAYQGIVV